MNNLRSLFLTLAFLLGSVSSQACTVCFGGADDNMVRGFTWGISLLLLLPFTLMGLFIGRLMWASRKKSGHE